LPKKWLDTFVDFHNQIVPQIPVLDMENGELPIDKADLLARYEQTIQRNGIAISVLLIENKTEIIGFSAVWIANKDKSTIADGGLTAVAERWRKNNIGTFLKAILLKYLTEKLPNINLINTSNSSINVPVLKINQTLGFEKKADEFIIEFKNSIL